MGWGLWGLFGVEGLDMQIYGEIREKKLRSGRGLPPPMTLEPSITPQLQEIIYRALEREPKNRYASAREFAHDLEHQDEVGVANRTEAAEWKRRESPPAHRNLLVATLILMPLAILVLLLIVAHHH